MAESEQAGRVTVVRHSLWLRITHWITAACLAGLFMSGLQIFNAHPALYFGDISRFSAPAVAITNDDTGTKGFVQIGAIRLDTTGLFGLSGPRNEEARAFPSWITLPAYQDLATGRRWHFLFAWLLVANFLVYLGAGFASRHFRQDIWPHTADILAAPRSALEHLRLRFGAHVSTYNPLQKLTYAAVVFVILPVMILAGLSMSPGVDAAAPLLPALFGGRQSARSVHFIFAFVLLGFFIVHVAMVILAGPIRELRSMTTGRMEIDGKGIER